MKCLLTQAFFFAILAFSGITIYAQQPSLLPNRTLLHFSLTKSHDGVEVIGTLSGSHTYDSIIIERGDSPSTFAMVTELSAGSNAGTHSFTYLDHTSGPGVYYYRVKLYNSVQNIQEISNTLMLKIVDEGSNLRIYNTILQSSNPSLSVYSIGNDEVNVQVADLSGHVFCNSTVRLNAGTNSININGLGSAQGYFVVALKNKIKTVTQKVIVQ